MSRRLAVALGVSLTVTLPGAPDGVRAQPRTPLRNVVADQLVQSIDYCQNEYRLTMASGERRRFPEINLRFKTDASTYGPEPGKPVWLPAGMRGDRGQVIFHGLDDLRRFLVERCEGDAR